MSYSHCQECGRPFWTKAKACREADMVRDLLEMLVAQEGSMAAAIRAFAERYGKNMGAVERKFYRLRGGQKTLWTEELRDELEVML